MYVARHRDCLLAQLGHFRFLYGKPFEEVKAEPSAFLSLGKERKRKRQGQRQRQRERERDSQSMHLQKYSNSKEFNEITYFNIICIHKYSCRNLQLYYFI